MKRTLGILLWLIVGTGVLALVLFSVARHYAGRSELDYARGGVVDGLSAPVEIVRDAAATPHIFAEDRDDALFALGYVHAQDRMWQMEMQRRSVSGRLAEVFGVQALEIDAQMRALGLRRAADASLQRLSRETRLGLEAYAAGINAWLDSLGGREAAPEFLALGVKPDPWTPVDSLSMLKLMAFRLSPAMAEEARRALFAQRFDDASMVDLFPEYPGRGVGALRRYRPPSPTHQGAALEPPLDGRRFTPFWPPESALTAGASNAWAVDGSRTATGAPLLASDPHLAFSAPGIWYLAHMDSPDFAVIGATLPGLPVVMIGRTRTVGWGLTTAYIDDQDLYFEQIKPDDPERYRMTRGWTKFDVREETFHIRGAPSVTRALRSTVNGPVIETNMHRIQAAIPPGHVAALRWTALDPDDSSMDALFDLNAAQTLDDALAAAARHVAPAQNIVMADASGIAMALAGRVPLRQSIHQTQGVAPSDGWDARNTWIGAIPSGEKPSVVRPFSGAVANANNRIGREDFPRHLSFNWAPPYRIARIEELINRRERHTDLSFELMQADSVSRAAQGLAPLMIAELARAGRNADSRLIAQMRAWDGDMDANDPEPLMFVAWMRALQKEVVFDELGPLAAAFQQPQPLFLERVLTNADGAGRWCDRVATVRRETCAEVVDAAFVSAARALSAQYGPPERWRWGAAHIAVHRHTPFGLFPRRILGVDWADRLFNVRHEMSGGTFTLNRSVYDFSPSDPFGANRGGGYRAIYNFSDLDRSLHIAAIGQSGHFMSPFYANLTDRWAEGEYLPMSMDRAEAEAGAIAAATLRPAAALEE